ncbi:MAG: DNA-binding response regulator [Crocinitomicaceae bacterium]|nr:DNA-binding response regulator [Crocinitomicaceae bacterium]|tara:strand:+ start:4943 stop:5647 length:705 start_codon:yes stop_codon:yes gene_type:complete
MNNFQSVSILLVEDDESLGFVTKDNLEDRGFHVIWAKDGQEGYEAFHRNKFDICILDVMLPKKDGFSLGKDIRANDGEMPLFFLTAKALQDDKIEGLSIGADDYITKPFSIDELTLRIENILKRTKFKEDQERSKDIYTIGSFTLDHKNLRLSRNGEEQKLTKKEADLLRLLCMHQGEVLERDTALRIVWGDDDYFLGRSMDVFITKLRKYLKPDPGIKINNVHGVGFKLEVEA